LQLVARQTAASSTLAAAAAAAAGGGGENAELTMYRRCVYPPTD